MRDAAAHRAILGASTIDDEPCALFRSGPGYAQGIAPFPNEKSGSEYWLGRLARAGGEQSGGEDGGGEGEKARHVATMLQAGRMRKATNP